MAQAPKGRLAIYLCLGGKNQDSGGHRSVSKTSENVCNNRHVGPEERVFSPAVLVDSEEVTRFGAGILTVKTGQGALRTIFSATLPMRSRLRPLRPWVAMTIKSDWVSSARLRISSTALPSSK